MVLGVLVVMLACTSAVLVHALFLVMHALVFVSWVKGHALFLVMYS